MLQRYSSKSENCHLLSSSKKFVVAAREIGIQAIHLNRDHELITELKALL
jgi:rRNA-processing protein FCF1